MRLVDYIKKIELKTGLVVQAQCFKPGVYKVVYGIKGIEGGAIQGEPGSCRALNKIPISWYRIVVNESNN